MIKTYKLVLRTLRLSVNRSTRIFFISVPSIFEFFGIRYDAELLAKYSEWRKSKNFTEDESSVEWRRAYDAEFPTDVDFVRRSYDALGRNEEAHLACNLEGFYTTIDFIKECIFPFGWKLSVKEEYVWREQVRTQATTARVHQRLFHDVEATRAYIESGQREHEMIPP